MGFPPNYLFYFWVCALLLLGTNCLKREEKYTLEGIRWEEKGEKTRALYQYELALRENPSYSEAQKRMGLLLAESPDSVATAIFYLEKYFESVKSEMRVNRELFRLYLSTGYEKEASMLLEELRFQGKESTAQFWEWNYLCHTKGPRPKDILQKLETSPEAQDPYYAPWIRTCAKSL